MSLGSTFAKRRSGRNPLFVLPEAANDSSSLQTVLGRLQDYIPQSYSPRKDADKAERLVWARFETLDGLGPTLEQGNGCSDSGSPVVLVLGLLNGFSVWIVQPTGTGKEVYSAVGEGEFSQVVSILPDPDKGLGEDAFSKHRPLMAVVHKGRSSGGASPFSCVQFISLSSAVDSNGCEVKRYCFEKKSILDIQSNMRVVAIVLHGRIVILDAASLEQKTVIKNGGDCPESWNNPIALGTRWLAFAGTKLHTHQLSCGGVSESVPAPVASTVMTTVKKGFAALTDTLSGLTGRAQSATPHNPSATGKCLASNSMATAVTVIDVTYRYPNGEVQQSELRTGQGIVAHFLAHSRNDVHVTALAFNHCGELLLSADSEGQCFNLFRILPNPLSSSCTRVEHLYCLYRGSTSAIVQDVSFSGDSRWVSVSTLNGTTHIFPILPYGGEVTVRTHCSWKVANQHSRFQTSAGINSISYQHTGPRDCLPLTATPVPHQNTNNTPPHLISPLQQIKQSYLFSGHSIGSTGGHSAVVGSVGDELSNSTCVRTIFTLPTPPSNSKGFEAKVGYGLLVLGSDGVLTEHYLQPYKEPSANEGEDAPIGLQHSIKRCWKFLSCPLEESLALPLDDNNPLITFSNELTRRHADKQGKVLESGVSMAGAGDWVPQVETLTHAPPTRRLWMGPQFSFRTVSSLEKSEDSRRTREGDEEDGQDFVGAVLPASQDLLDFLEFSQPHLQPLPSPRSGENGPGSLPNSLDGGVEVFGSWKDVAPHERSGPELEKMIIDAMADNGSVSTTLSQGGRSTVSTGPSLSLTGFHTPE